MSKERRARLKGDHPHAGKAGTLIGMKAVGGELVAHIRLDGAYEGECFASPGQWTPCRQPAQLSVVTRR